MRSKQVVKWARLILPVLMLLGVSALWVTNCSGPRPMVSDARVEAPSTPDKPYHVSARVENDSPGHGQVRVVFRLHDTTTGHVYQQSEQITLRSGEAVIVGVDINAPPGHYTPEITANYPP
ncbi:MAG: hypothetical protein ACM3N4_05150 [Nitrososphaerota archaeon]